MATTENERGREISRLLRIRRTVMRMLMDRGYMVSQGEANISRDDFERDFTESGKISREKLQVLASLKDNPSDRIMVFFPNDSPLGIAAITKFTEIMNTRDVNSNEPSVARGIIVYRDRVSSHARATRSIELFMEEELLVNITEHSLVPLHIPLSDVEKKQLLERYRLKETQLPRMQEADPVARYYGLRRGRVVKIIRPSETAGRYVTYRLVF